METSEGQVALQPTLLVWTELAGRIPPPTHTPYLIFLFLSWSRGEQRLGPLQASAVTEGQNYLRIT